MSELQEKWKLATAEGKYVQLVGNDLSKEKVCQTGVVITWCAHVIYFYWHV